MIILNYNDAFNTISYLSKIETFSSVDKYIVVDNHSTDNSYQKFLELPNTDKVIFLEAKVNRGYAHGNNIGIKYAVNNFSVKNIIISNPDIEVKENTIKSILEELDADKKVSAATGVICDTNGNIAFNFAWRLPDYVMMLQNTSIITTKVLKKMGKSRFYSTDNLKKKQVVDVLSGCFFIIKANAFKQAGYFEEDTFLYNEENILFYKLKHLGYKQIVLCEHYITHFQGSSTNKTIKNFFLKQKIVRDSEQVYLNKYLEISLIQRIVYHFCSFLGMIEKYIIYRIKLFRRGVSKI